jgi:23S rRNA pseudouridine1911/1915/1917 synthase
MIITGKKFSKPELSRVINGDTKLAATDTSPEKFRLDHLLVKQHPEYNRSSLQTFIKSGFVTVDGEIVTKPNSKFESDAEITLNVPASAKLPPRPPVIYEDNHVLVLNKPAGLLSMAKGEYCPEPTLEDYGLLVHRLDRDTSGVVILAKDPETQKMLRKQFQDRKTRKTYYAVVEGHPKLPEAMIDLPIARNLKRPTTFQVDQNGKPSQTYYKVLQQNNKYSLLELKPTTGRTHQLRVHLKYLNTPILGDIVYGNPDERLFLHAKDLEITIPSISGGERKVFTTDLPPEFLEKTK